LIDAIAKYDKVCQQLNLPVQSGDDDILKAMGRGYTVEHYKKLVDELRQKVPAIALSTDVIIGFPGESRQQFENTVELLEDLRFDAVHSAVYSPRAETLAARKFKDDVSLPEKKERLHKVEKLQKAIAGEINSKLRGKTVEVLVTAKKGDKWQGRSRSDKLVFLKSSHNLLGKLVDVKIEKTSPWSLQGSLEIIKN
jgi:tRNA-2-methylthio-N6-dimethylallyladenosine synthase